MRIWSTTDGKAHLVLSWATAPANGAEAAPSTNNCGIGTINGLYLQWEVNTDAWGPRKIALFPPKAAEYTAQYIADYKRYYSKEPPCPLRDWKKAIEGVKFPADFSDAALYKLIEENFVKFLKAYPLQYGMYLLSNRVVDSEQSVFEQGKPFAQRGNAWLMKLIRDTKSGMLITSPIVNNIAHSGNSGIMAAIWITPSAAVFHDKVGISKGLPDNIIEESNKKFPRLAEGTKKTVEIFYGRKSMASRLEQADDSNVSNPGAGPAVAAR